MNKFQYINFIETGKDGWVMHTAMVGKDDAKYLRKAIAHLQPMPDDYYLNGLAALQYTAVRCSYVLDGRSLYWCSEFDPGLVIVKLSPGAAALQWVVLRSPVPHFGGREPLPADVAVYDEDASNPQYNLIFTPWDAQFDPMDYEAYGFSIADAKTHARFDAAMARLDALAKTLHWDDEEARFAWMNRCLNHNLKAWCGEGLRLPATSSKRA